MAAKPFLLFDSIFRRAWDTATANVTASTEASGYPAANAQDWRVYYKWRASNTTSPVYLSADLGAASTRTADTLVVGAHNLKTCGATTLKVQRSSDAVTWTDVTGATTDPSTWIDTWPITVQFTAPSAYRYWRVRIEGTLSVAPEIGIITLGRRLEFPTLDPSIDVYGEEPIVEAPRERGGAFLGVTRRAVSKSMTLAIPPIGYTNSLFWKTSAGPNWDTDFVPHTRRGELFWYAPFFSSEPYHVWLSALDGKYSLSLADVTTRRTGSIPITCWVPE